MFQWFNVGENVQKLFRPNNNMLVCCIIPYDSLLQSEYSWHFWWLVGWHTARAVECWPDLIFYFPILLFLVWLALRTFLLLMFFAPFLCVESFSLSEFSSLPYGTFVPPPPSLVHSFPFVSITPAPSCTSIDRILKETSIDRPKVRFIRHPHTHMRFSS